MPQGIFLSHTWRPDELGRSTHSRVVAVAAEFARRGVRAWLDENEGFAHDVDECMASGVDSCDVFAVFLTRAYFDKVDAAAKDPSRRDNCYKEFSYAQQSGKLFLPVIFEPTMSSENWPCGIVKMHCAGKMFVDGSLLPEADVCDEMLKVIHRLRRMSGSSVKPNHPLSSPRAISKPTRPAPQLPKLRR